MPTRTWALFAAALYVVPACAQEVVPVPRQKPPHRAGAAAAPIPIPRPNPKRAGSAIAAPAPGPGAGPCLDRLARLNVVYEALPPIAEGACGAAAPLLVSAVDRVRLEPAATITCDMAENLHLWIDGVVQPAARRQLKTEVTAIDVAASYVCRARNSQPGGKLSEHAKANALDMAGFRFARAKDVTVGDGWGALPAFLGLSKGGSFLDEVRKGACGFFTTVLGPGSDRYHGNHFHLDVLQRRGGYRICQ